ncbi:MAG TPA: SGNH/GDSL hydrolase family protein [Candidatus Brocadiia bacterium]|nr:SGNH/GDSL hydrolase family protein [Candidatus Brocadiia bacterium]
MAVKIKPDDARLSWLGVVSLEKGRGCVAPWRIPFAERELFNEGVRVRGSHGAGVRIAFASNATRIAGAIAPWEGSMSNLDLCCDGQLIASQPMAGKTQFAFDGLPARKKLVELWLPQMGQFKLKSLELNPGASIAAARDRRPKWVVYGSSITQCATAQSPLYTWPAVVARAMGYNLTCLGYGGNCHLEPMVARMIRDLHADYLAMCVGINIYGNGSLSPRTYREALIGFVKIVREKHAGKPFVVMSAIISPPRETVENRVGFTLEQMRQVTKDAVDLLRAHGDKKLYYINGLDILGPAEAGLLPDNLHPNAEGYRLMGQRFAAQAAQKYFR